MPESGPRAKTVAWVAKHMRKNPDIPMADLKKLGKKEGHNVYPLIIGLARKELGMSRPKPAGRKKATRKKAGRKKAGRKAATRRKKASRRSSGSPEDAISAVLTRLRELERENEQLRRVIEKIGALTDGV